MVQIVHRRLARGRHVGVGLGPRDSRTQARDDGVVLAPAFAALRRPEWRPDINRRTDRKPRRHDADHGVRLPAQHDRAPDHRGVAAEPRPQTVAENRQRRSAGHVFFRREFASDGRRHAQDLEKSRGHTLLLHVLRLPACHQVHAHAKARGRCHVDGLDRVAQQFPRRAGLPDLVVAAAFEMGDDLRQTLRLGIRQWPQQHTIDHRVDRGVRADAQREGQRGSNGENGAFDQDTDGVAKIAHIATLDEAPSCSVGNVSPIVWCLTRVRHLLLPPAPAV